MAGPGKIQVATHGTLYARGDSALRHIPNGPGSFGGSFAYGINRKFNLRARYDWVALESKPEPDSLPERRLEHAVGMEMKFSQDGRTLATSLGMQLYPNADIQVASMTVYGNWYLRENLFLCFAPYLNTATVRGRLRGFTTAMNVSLTYVFGKVFYLRPELGSPFFLDSPELLMVNLGLALGLEF